jgi:peptidyl-prolyl cis-trans isomerase SurA
LIQARKGYLAAVLLGVAFILGAVLLGVTLMLTGCPGRTDGDVMAKVNGYKISRAELDKSYNRQITGSPQKPSVEQEQLLRLQLLAQIINRQLYLQKAEKLGIVATDEEIESRVNQLKAPYTTEEFKKRLQDMGFTEDEYKQELRRNLAIDKLRNKEILSKVAISDADIQSYYNEHKSQFNVIEPQYHLAQIVVSTQPPGSEPISNPAQGEAQARDRIKVIHNHLESGEDFADVAAKASEDSDTARSGGELGWIPESQLKTNIDPATRDAVAKLKPGQYTDVIPITNPAQKVVGYRIVKLLGKEPAGQRTFDDPNVQQQIRTQLRNQREQFLVAAYDENLRNNAQIRNYFVEQSLKNASAQK